MCTPGGMLLRADCAVLTIDAAAQVRTGGKGSVRRKKKAVHKTASTDDKRLQVGLGELCTCTAAFDVHMFARHAHAFFMHA